MRKGRSGNIEIANFGLSAFSMFFMQSASFLAFQGALERGRGRSNGQSLFSIGRIPSDNYIRDTLDEADPELLRPCFERMETLLAAPAMRQAFGRLGGRTLIAWDGTEYFCSNSASDSSAPLAEAPDHGCRRDWEGGVSCQENALIALVVDFG